MNTNKTLLISVLTLALMYCSAEVSEAASMGTAFTYQGRLVDSNDAVNGLYDFQFKLYDANTIGTQHGITIDVNDLDVIDGYFTVELDFGGDTKIFGGQSRWLDIAVRPGLSTGAYTILTPRQAITLTPYALLALKSKTLIAADGDPADAVYVDNDGRVGIGTTTPTKPLQVENEYENAIYGLVTSPFSSGGAGIAGETNGNGSGVMGEGLGDGASGVLGIAQGEYGTGVRAIAFSSTGATKAINADNWSSTGVGVRAEMIASQGKSYGMYSWNHSEDGIGIYGWADSPTGTTYGVYGKVNSPDGYSGYFEGTGRFVDDLGIGTKDPANGTKLRVTQDGNTAAIHAQNDSGIFAFGITNQRIGVFASATSDDENEKYGVLGLVAGNTGAKYGIFGRAFGSGPNYGVWGQADGGVQSFAGFFTGSSPAVMIEDMSDGAALLRFNRKDSPGDHYIALGNNNTLYFKVGGGDRMVIDNSGNIGIGTAAPQAKLQVSGGQTILQQEAWQTPVFQNSWRNYGAGYNPAQYYKDSMGIVHLRGLVTGGTIGQIIFTLPAGYRPEFREMHAAVTNPNVFARVDVSANGEVVAVAGDSFFVSLDGITFRAAN